MREQLDGLTGGKLIRFAPLVPLAAAGAYLAFLSVKIPRLLYAAFLSSDVASIPVLSREIASGHASIAVVSIATYYSSFLFNLATNALPFHRVVWEALSITLSLAGVGLSAWAVWRVAGRAAGILALAFGIAASPVVLMEFLWLRGATWFTGALLAFYLTGIVGRDGSLKTKTAVAGPIGMGVIVGANLVSDPLLMLSGVLPFFAGVFASMFVLARESKTRLLRTTGLISISTLVAASAIYFGAQLLGFRVRASLPGGQLHLATPFEVKSKLVLFAEDIAGFANGQLGRIDTIGWGRFIAALAAFAALGCPLFLLSRYAKNRTARSLNPARFALVVFWATSVMAVSAAFIFSSLPAEGLHSSRYLIPVFFAMTATVALWARCGPRRLVAAGLGTVVCALSIGGMIQFEKDGESSQLYRQGSALVSVLRREGLTRGYSSYLHALGLTWMTDMRVGAHPVYDCGSKISPQLCAFPVNTMTGWYRPRPNQKTFLLIGDPGPFELGPSPPGTLGVPLKIEKAEGFSIYVYGFDIASKLGPAGP